jgi:anti-sigma B factor antagonist
MNYEISLGKVGFVDSTGIGFILQLIERIKECEMMVNIRSIQREVYEVFQMLQIDEIVGREVFAGIQII